MAAFGRYVMNRIQTGITALNLNMTDTEHAAWDTPSVDDVLAVKDVLFRSSQEQLPIELIDIIIDLAEYWPRTVAESTQSRTVRAGPGREDNMFCLRSLPIGYNPVAVADSEYGFPSHRYSHIQERILPRNTLPFSSEGLPQQVLDSWRSQARPRGQHPCRKIVFTLSSKDQGWGGGRPMNTSIYTASYSWFDVGKERIKTLRRNDPTESPPQIFDDFLFRLGPEASPDDKPLCLFESIKPILTTNTTDSTDPPSRIQVFEHPLLPGLDRLQSNVTASAERATHVITWRADDDILPESSGANDLEALGRGGATGSGEYVRDLHVGDVVTIWAKARFVGWSNVVESVKMEIFWAV